jgi:acyl-CoA thioester hydrolase
MYVGADPSTVLRTVPPLQGGIKMFELRITATSADIDELGHVNNAVWVRWIQEVATAHWEAVAPAAHRAAYIWVVTRHEIDYLRALLAGESVVARTWVAEAAKGARFDRHVEFVGADGKARVRAKTTWAILDKARGRPVRVPPEVASSFAGEGRAKEGPANDRKK